MLASSRFRPIKKNSPGWSNIPVFDSYLIVDWSAAGRPKTGPDSIWVRLDAPDGIVLENPPTRAAAMGRVAELIAGQLGLSRRILTCFDFGFGYPAGFASALGLSGPPWRAAWDELSDCVDDRATNANNRFEAAAHLNQRLSNGRGPFWGCPPGAEGDFLGPRRSDASFAGLAERRICEQRLRRSQPVWKLYTSGSVGSQTLVGIPRLSRLLDHPYLAGHAAVWPFQTGLEAPRQPAAIFAEIFPSLRIAEPRAGEVKDAAQVRTIARWLRDLDRKGRLEAYFCGPPDLDAEQRRQVEQEEGWILGIL